MEHFRFQIFKLKKISTKENRKIHEQNKSVSPVFTNYIMSLHKFFFSYWNEKRPYIGKVLAHKYKNPPSKHNYNKRYRQEQIAIK